MGVGSGVQCSGILQSGHPESRNALWPSIFRLEIKNENSNHGNLGTSLSVVEFVDSALSDLGD
jgi:hypothetical protein